MYVFLRAQEQSSSLLKGVSYGPAEKISEHLLDRRLGKSYVPSREWKKLPRRIDYPDFHDAR